jgi:imidazolonepropionase-like amidohydrolase
MRLAFAASLLVAGSASFAAVATTAIRDATVIDGTGAPPQAHSTIVFRGERIIALGPARTTRIPKSARVINGRGKYVIPGLWDMHVHLRDKENVLPLYVARGITGVRDMGSDRARIAAWRKAIEDRKAIGPHIVTSGPPFDGAAVKTPDEARRAFDRLDGMNVDFIDVLPTLPRQAFFALAEQCRHWRVPFAGHVPDEVRASEAIEERIGSIEHLSGIVLACSNEEQKIRAGKAPKSRAFETFSEDRARELFKRCALLETRQTPALSYWERRACPEAQREFEVARRLVGLMKQCGVQILAGTDTGHPNTEPGKTLHHELELLVQAGLTPAEALRSATVEPARFLGWDESVGALKAGMVADLVMLDGDPLRDIRNVSKISGVAARGVYVRVRRNSNPAADVQTRQKRDVDVPRRRGRLPHATTDLQKH